MRNAYRALEERVAHLERMVDALTQARDLARDTSENTHRRLIEGVSRRTRSSRIYEHACFHDAQFRTSAGPPPRRNCCPTWGRLELPLFLDAGLNTGPFSLGRVKLCRRRPQSSTHYWRPEDASITRSPLRWRRTTVSFL